MFGLGLWEIGVVVLLAVMLFPPKELPKLARSIARTYGSIRRTAEDFKNQIMEDEDLRAPIDEVRSAYNDARWELKKAEAAARRELAKAKMEAERAAELAKREKAKREAVEEAQGEEGREDEADAGEEPGSSYEDAHRDPATPDEADDQAEPLPSGPAGRVASAAPRRHVPPPPALAKDDDADKAESSVA